MKDWLDKLTAELGTYGDEPPKGFKNKREIQKRLNYKSESGAVRWIRKAIEAGKLQKVIVRRPSPHGLVRVPYYGPK